MAERRRGKQKRQQEEPDKPSKEEYAVAKFLRFSIPSREGKLVGMKVKCFTASKAVDALLESKWSTTQAKSDILFTNRQSCIEFLNGLLDKGLFHRAAKAERKKERDRKKKKTKDEDAEAEKEEEKKVKKDKKGKNGKEKEREKEKDKEEREESEEGEKEEKEKGKKEKSPEKKEDKKDDDKKKKRERKLRLEMHPNQLFKDGDEIYVWIYDPIQAKTFVIGLLLVLGAIGICLFPLWPPEVRLGVYYLSLAAAGFVGVILSLCIIRLALFCIVWAVTFGNHHFWFLPNLTEDVGFFESFVPLYKHDAPDGNKDSSSSVDDSNAEKNSSSTEKDATEKSSAKTTSSQAAIDDDKIAKDGVTKGEKEQEHGGDRDGGEVSNESEIENDNGYEIVDHGDFGAAEEEDDEDGEDDEEIDELADESGDDETHDLEPKKTK